MDISKQHESEQGLFEEASTAGVSQPTASQGSPKSPTSGATGVSRPLSGLLAGGAGGNGNGKRTSFGTPGNGAGSVLTVGDKSIDVANTKFSTMSTTRLHEFLTRYTTEFDFKKFIDDISYQGFDRVFYINNAFKKVTVSQFARFALIGAIRGSNFQKVVDNSEKVDVDLKELVGNGIVVKVAKKRTDLTILRFTASIPQWCAYYMMGHGTPKKILDHALPSYLQFPAAASIPMTEEMRKLHVDFCIKFSTLINGTFNPNIYLTAFQNQIPLVEIPESLRLALGVQSMSESKKVGVSELIKELGGVVAKKT